MPKPKRIVRPWVELLEDRVTPAGPSFVNLDNGIQFRLVKPQSDSWTSKGGVYSTTAEVMIGLQGGDKFQPVLAIENGVSIDTNSGRQLFTITKPQGKDNFLDYFPNSFSKLSRLFEFKDAYTIRGDDLKNLVDLTPNATATVTIAGASVVPLTDDNGLKINGNLGGSTLVPSKLVITRSQDALKLPAVSLNGRLSLNVGGKLVQKLITHLNINIGDDATYSVKADAAGLVQLVSKTGSGVWISITPKEGEGTASVGPVNIQMTFIQFNWDQTNKALSIAGRFNISLKDDDPDTTTPFQLDLGDQANPGLTIDFSKSSITRFQASFVPGTKGGSSRASFTFAGATVSLDGLFFLYDGAKEQFGVGGGATLTWAGNNVNIVMGNAKQDQPGLFIENGIVKSFNGRITGKFEVGKLGLGVQGNVFASYQADKKTVTLSGDLKMAFEGVTAGVILPSPGLVIRDGVFSLPGGFGFTIDGSFGIKDFQFQFDNLELLYTHSANNNGGFDDVWTVTGGATLSSFFNVSVDLTGGGLIIRNGSWDLQGIKVHAGNLTAGGFGLQDFLLEYAKTQDGTDYEVKVSATLALGLINVGAAFDIKNGHVSSIAADFKAIGEDPGLPIGDTVLFITELGFEVDNLDNLSQWVFQGTVAVAFGEGISFEGQTVRLFTAEGHFKADSQEFDLDKADFSVMDGFLAKGSGTLDLNWGQHVYHVGLDVSGFDGLITLHADFNLNQFNQVNVLADIGLQVPIGVPFIGGDKLADLEGLLYIDPVVKENDLVAAWIDINTYIFGHWRLGGEFLFYPTPGQDRFQILWGSDVEKLEQEAISDGKVIHTIFTPTITATDPAPNQSLFTYEWESTNEVGDVTITVPGVAQPVVIPKGSAVPVSFKANGKTYVVQPVKELQGDRRFAFIIGPDTSVNALAPLPTGKYTVDVVTAEKTTGRLTHAEAFAPPEIKAVTVAQPTDSNLVTIQASYVTADPDKTTIDLYYTIDPAGGSGTFIKSIPLTDKIHQSGAIKTTWDITNLPWKQNLYVFARASDVAKDLSGNTGKRTGSATLAATSVSPYADLTVQLKLTPAVPVDSQPETLAGWPILWQQMGSDGKTVTNTVRDVTDSFGQAGITAGKGTNWTMTVAPKNWDGFAPLPGKGQTGDASGQLITMHLTGGTYALPRQIVAGYHSQASIHGQVSLDLTGNQAKELGGAGLTSEIVYVDLNNNSQLDSGEPRTMSDLKGYYDLRFPLPTVTTNYTIRIKPDADTDSTFVRTNPDSTTDFSFKTGISYNVTVNPNGKTLPLFDHRDFLLQHQILISGFAFVSGPTGVSFGPGSVPIPEVVVHLEDANGHQLASTTTAPDGSYHFSLPTPGKYIVSTDQQNPTQVNVPGRHALLLDTTHPGYPLTMTTPDGQPLYQVGYTSKSNFSPAMVSADLYGNGGLEIFTLGWSPENGGSLYLVHIEMNGVYAPVLLANNFDINNDTLPGLSWFSSSNSNIIGTNWIVIYFADHALKYDASSPDTSPITFTSGPQGVTQIAGYASDPHTHHDAWLLTSKDSSTWSVLTQNDAGAATYSTFDFSHGTDVRPLQLGGQGYVPMTIGDFDGDGINDISFVGVTAAGKVVVASLFSRERDGSNRFTQTHTLVVPDVLSISAIPVGNGTPGASTLSLLAIHTFHAGESTAELALFMSQPATGAALASGSPATSFLAASSFLLPGSFLDQPNLASSTDYVRDMNGDGYSDLVVILAQLLGTPNAVNVAVFLNNGNGQLQAAPLVTIPTSASTPASAMFTSGLISDSGKLPNILTLADDGRGTSRLDASVLLADNTSFVSSSYLVEVNSPGSYGGYDFGFVNASGHPTPGLTGTAYVDINRNGHQDAGEPNLVDKRIQVTVRDVVGDVSQLVLTTDATGKFSVMTPGSFVIQAAGLFPSNSQPFNTPPGAPVQFNLLAPILLPRGGQGASVGSSVLIQTLDYGDTFTLGVGARLGLQPNQAPAGAALGVEYHALTAPQRTWTSGWQISDDVGAAGVPGFPYPGSSGAGSSGGFAQATGTTYLGMEYGLRDQYIVQFDAVQTAEPVVISTGPLLNTIYGAGSLSVLFLPGASGIELTNQQGVNHLVWDTKDGNIDPHSQALQIQTGAKVGTWNNYAVAFDRVKNTLTIYVNQKKLKTLDLTAFADGAYKGFSNNAVIVGAGGTREWLDNFQIGAPYVGYQAGAGPIAAYTVPMGTSGNGPWVGSLGMDFDVNRPVVVTSLGAFDSGGDGFKDQVHVVLYNRETKEQVAEAMLGSGGVPGALQGGSRFATLATPLRLEAGFQGTIVAWELSGADDYGYYKFQTKTWTTDDIGGALAFVGHGSYNEFGGGFPATQDDSSAPADAYAAGTFLAQPVDPYVALVGYDFGLKEALTDTGAIQGAVVLAPNKNSNPFAPGLPAFAGVRVYLDLNGDGGYTAGEPFAITDVHGIYRIGGLRPGSYIVKQDLSPSYITRPAFLNADVLGGQSAYAKNFSDVKPTSVDFNTDGWQDYVRLVPIDSRTTQIRLDVMNSTVVGRVQVVGTFDPRKWQLAGVSDFNNDGNADLLFENKGSRELWYWQLDNGEYQRSKYLGKLPAGWHVTGVGDLDGQDSADLVLRQSGTGLLKAWLMNENAITGTVNLGSLGHGRVLEGIIDVNGDGNSDLLIHDLRNGNVLVRSLERTRVLGTKEVGRIDPRSHLIGSQPWKANDAAGLYLDWENAATGSITRWQFNYVQGLLRTVTDSHLGNRQRLGHYLTYVGR